MHKVEADLTLENLRRDCSSYWTRSDWLKGFLVDMETLHSMWTFLLFLISIISEIGTCILYILYLLNSTTLSPVCWTCVLHVDWLSHIGQTGFEPAALALIAKDRNTLHMFSNMNARYHTFTDFLNSHKMRKLLQTVNRGKSGVVHSSLKAVKSKCMTSNQVLINKPSRPFVFWDLIFYLSNSVEMCD